ncbi:MAG: MASE1 domain-containing protein, partial [Bacillota bacterium]
MRLSALRESGTTPEFARHLGAAILVGLGYWALARYSLSLPVKASGISYIWPADGLALGSLLCVRRRYWPLMLAGVFLGNFAASNKPLELNLLYSSFQVFESTLVGSVIVRALGPRPRIDSVACAARMLAWMSGAMAVAILGSNSIDWLIHRGDFWYVWSIWYVSDLLGMLIVAPLVIALKDAPRDATTWSAGRTLEAAFVLVGIVVATYLSFVGPAPGSFSASALVPTPLLVPAIFMLWAAVRFGMAGTMITTAIMALLSFRYTAGGFGPFARQHTSLHTAFVHLQMSLAIATCMMIFIAARTAEWARALAESQASRKRLEFAIEASDMVVFEVTPATGEVAWSGDTAFVLGMAPDEIAHMSQWRRLLHPEDRRRVLRLHAELVGGKLPSLTLDYRMQKRDGTYVTVAADAYAVR